MKLKAILGVVTFTLKKYSPEILLGVGITGVVGSTIMACSATFKADRILDEHAAAKERLDDCALLRETSEVEYTIQEEKSDRRILTIKTTGRFIRLYAPSATMMILSIGCILGAHHIMRKRNIALMAAYKLLEEAFTKYRKRVVSELGEAADTRFYYGEEANGETRTITDSDGVEHEQDGVTLHLSGFSRSFGPERPDQIGSWEGSTQWSKVHDYNIDFLNSKMDHFNGHLLVKGFVTVNDVFSELGFPTTEAGMICGWKYKSDRGDGYISFRPRGIDGGWQYGIDGDEILVDFNIDGVIFDQNVARKEMK